MAEDFSGELHGGNFDDFTHLSLDEISAIVDADYANIGKLRAAADGARELRDFLVEQRDVMNADLRTFNENYRSREASPVVLNQFELALQSLTAMSANADQHHTALVSMADEVERVKPVIDELKAERGLATDKHGADPHAFDSLGSPSSGVDGFSQVMNDITADARDELKSANIVYQVVHTTQMDEPRPYQGPVWTGQEPFVSPGSGYQPGSESTGVIGGARSLDGPASSAANPSGPDLQNPGTGVLAPGPAPTPGPGTAPPPVAGTPLPPPMVPGVPPTGAPRALTPPPGARPGGLPVNGPRPTPGLTPGRPGGTPGMSRPGGTNPVPGRGSASTTGRASTAVNPGRGTNPASGRPGTGSTPNRAPGNPAAGRSGGVRNTATNPTATRKPVLPGQSRGSRAASPRIGNTRGATGTFTDDSLTRGLKDRATRGVIRGVGGDRTMPTQQAAPRVNQLARIGKVIGSRPGKVRIGGAKPAYRSGSLTGKGLVSSGLKLDDKTWTRAKPAQSTEPAKGSVLGPRRTGPVDERDARRRERAKRRQQRRDIIAGKAPRTEMTGEWFTGVRERTVPGVIGATTPPPNAVSRRDAGRVFGSSGWEG